MSTFKFIKTTLEELGRDRGSLLAAAFAYTGIFALIPAMIVVISIAGIVYGQKAAEGQLFSNFTDIVGSSTGSTVQHAIAHVHQSSHSTLALAIGVTGSLIAASALTSQLRSSFDIIFSVVPEEGGGIKRMVYEKVKNVLILVIGSLFVAASVVATSLLSAAGAKLAAHIGTPAGTLQAINLLASFISFIIFLYVVYRVFPDVKLPRKVVFTAAVLVGVLFLIGKLVLGWVIGHNGTASAYGTAASLITLLLWFYYTGEILFIGAEGIKVYANSHELKFHTKSRSARQKTINIKAKNDLAGEAVEKFARGFTKQNRRR